MALGAAAASHTVFGILSIGVAVGVLAAGPGRRCNRLFAAVVAMRGLLSIVNRIDDVVASPRLAAAIDGMRPALVVWLPFALAAFLVVYLRPRAPAWVGPALMGTGAAVAAWVTLRPCIYRCTTDGPLSLLGPGPALLEGLAAVVLARSLLRGAATGREIRWLLANVFVVLAIVDGLLPVTISQALGISLADTFSASALRGAQHVLFLAGAALGLLGAVVLVTVAWRDAAFLGRTHVPVTLALLGVTTGAVALLPLSVDPRETALFLAGLARLVLPALAAYGLVRYGVFTTPRRGRRAVNRSLMMAIFLAVYFIASESTAAFVGDRTGNAFVGILAAAFVVLLIVPIERAVDRFTAAVAPPAPTEAEPIRDRRRFFREQMDIVWLDGQMGVKERLMMDRLRARLGLPSEEAAAIELEAAKRFHGGRSSGRPERGL